MLMRIVTLEILQFPNLINYEAPSFFSSEHLLGLVFFPHTFLNDFLGKHLPINHNACKIHIA